MTKSITQKTTTKQVQNLKNYFLSCATQIKHLTCLFILLFSSMGWGQTYLANQSFDATTFVPTNWTNLPTSGSNTWTRVTAGTYPTCSPRSGAGMAMFNSYTSPGTGVRSLITPVLDFSTAGTKRITFWMYRDNGYATDADKIEIYTNTSANLTGATLLGTINRSRSLAPTVGTDGWYEYYYDVTTTSATTYVIFKAVGAWGNNMYIDDINVSAPPVPCSGTPSPGNTLASVNPVGSGSSTVLSLQNATSGSGVSYQWQSSTDNSTWANVASGGTSATYSASPTTATYYRCNVTCSGNTGTSNSLLVNVTYCASTGPSTQGADYFTNFTITGGITNLNNSSTYSTNGYGDFTAQNTSQYIGSTVNFSMTSPGVSDGSSFGIFVDWNQDGDFLDTNESPLLTITQPTSNPSGIFTVPSDALLGNTRMRIVVKDATGSVLSCNSALADSETEDYTFTVVAIPACSGTPTAGAISSGNQTLLSGATPSNIVVTGFSVGQGITFQWEQSSDDITWSNVVGGSGATTATYTPPAFAGTTIYYRCNVTCTNSSLSAQTNSVSINPCPTFASTISINGATAVSGTSYPTLTAAISSLAICGITQPTILELTSNYNSSAETFPITIPAISGASATNTLTIKPASGVTATISGSSSSSIFKLNGADYIIIDGSNSGGTDKSLTISNTNTGTLSAVIWLGSASASNGATNNTFKNCIITGNAPTTTLVGIISSSGTTIGSAAEIANAYNTYNNNTVNTANYGIWVEGPTGNESGTVISGNLIGSATAGNKIGLMGILVNNQSGVSVTNNTIFGANTSTTYTASGICVDGTQSGGTISGNKISDIKNTNTGGYLANGILLASTSTTAAISVYNNFIFDIAGYGWSAASDNGHGIVLYSGGGYNLYNNTINMNTNQTLTTSFSSAIYIYSTLVTAASVNIRNNIFANTQTGGAPVANRYAIYCAAANTIFGTINHNNYYTSGTHLGYRGSNRTTLAEVVTGFGGNANSISALPSFTSATDMHLTAVASASGNAALKAGTYLSTVLTDYDGETRNVTIPTIGADEIFINGFWTGTSSTAYETSGNWDDNAVPSSGANITIPTGVTNKPVLASDKTIGTLALGSGTTLSIGSNTLTINGAVSGTGTLTGSSTSNLTIGGTAGTLKFTNGSRSLKDLTLNSSATATLGTALAITAGTTSGTVTVGTSATLTTGGNLTLKSDANGTARVGNSAGTISGNVTVERFIPSGKRAFRLLSPAVTTTTFISGNWQGQTHITGGASGGFDVTETNNPSMFTYNNQVASGTGWTPIANTNATNLTAGVGYRMLVRGDRNVNLTVASQDNMNAAITLSATGTLRTGTVTLNASSTPAINNTANTTTADYSLVGNPYQSAVDWNAVTKSGIDASYYAWDPNMGTSIQRGRYVVFNGTVNSVDGGVGSSNVGQFIQPGQAFFVKNTVSGTAGTLTFEEADKASTNANVFRTNNQTESTNFATLSMQLYDPNELAIGGYPIDATKAVFGSDYTNELGLGDATKLEAAGENIAWFRNNTKLAIDAAAPVTTSDELAMKTLRLVANKNYTFKIQTTNFDTALTPYLVDNFLNTQTEIATSQAFLATFATTSNVASYNENRFKIVFQNAVLSTDTFATQVGLYPNPSKGNGFYLQLPATTQATVRLYNTLGQEIAISHNEGHYQANQSLAAGVYHIMVTQGEKTSKLKWIVE